MQTVQQTWFIRADMYNKTQSITTVYTKEQTISKAVPSSFFKQKNVKFDSSKKSQNWQAGGDFDFRVFLQYIFLKR